MTSRILLIPVLLAAALAASGCSGHKGQAAPVIAVHHVVLHGVATVESGDGAATVLVDGAPTELVDGAWSCRLAIADRPIEVTVALLLDGNPLHEQLVTVWPPGVGSAP